MTTTPAPTGKARARRATGHADPQVQIRLPQELLDRLDAACDRHMLGRNLVVVRGIEHVVRFLEARPDPFVSYLDDGLPAPAYPDPEPEPDLDPEDPTPGSVVTS